MGKVDAEIETETWPRNKICFCPQATVKLSELMLYAAGAEWHSASL